MYKTIKNPIFSSRLLNAKRENFTPQVQWIEDESNRMLLIQLPGFKRQEIRVQLSNAGKLFIKGSRQTADNKFIDVDQSFDVPKDVITNKISGKFEDGHLTLIMPKTVITEAVTEEKSISNEATKEKVSKQEATKEDEPKQKEEKHEQGKIDKENKDENVREEKTTSKEANQMEKSTITEAMASFVKDAKSRITDAMHNEPTPEKEKEYSAGADTKQNELNSKPKAEEMPKNTFGNDNSTKDEDMGNSKAKKDEGIKHQEEKKAEQAIEKMKENYNEKVAEVSSKVKSKMEKRKETMQKMKLKVNEIYRDTPKEIKKKINKMRQGEDGWLNTKYIDGAVEKINRNRNTIAIAIMAFSIGFYVSHRLKARSG